MEVILLSDVKGKGKKGSIIKVKDGYGNYLINNSLAVLKTAGSKKVLDKQKKDEANTIALEREEALKLKKKLERMTLEFKVKVGKEGKVFGSVSSKQIASELKKKEIDIDRRKIIIDGSINTLGISVVSIILYKDIKANLKIHLQ